MSQALKNLPEHQDDEVSGLRRIPSESRSQVGEALNAYTIHEIQKTLSDLFCFTLKGEDQGLISTDHHIACHPQVVDKLIRSDAEKGFDLADLNWTEEAHYPLVDQQSNRIFAYANVKRNGQGFLSCRIEYPEVGSA